MERCLASVDPKTLPRAPGTLSQDIAILQTQSRSLKAGGTSKTTIRTRGRSYRVPLTEGSI